MGQRDSGLGSSGHRAQSRAVDGVWGPGSPAGPPGWLCLELGLEGRHSGERRSRASKGGRAGWNFSKPCWNKQVVTLLRAFQIHHVEGIP